LIKTGTRAVFKPTTNPQTKRAIKNAAKLGPRNIKHPTIPIRSATIKAYL